MDNERNENDKLDEILLPGFRFHPTDEELVGFYLKRKIQQRPLSIELIKQLDIYKYDPWDLPKLATTGEKEWYFYCPRDRKYRNSARPNRVTGAGFWKATGTDRPIYSSVGSKCIGLKKSLVFYKGKAAKGIKTDWMMHEFRLPPLTDHSVPPPKRFMDKAISANDSWAICRILKKTNSIAQRTLSQSWVSPLPATAAASATVTDAIVKSSYNVTQLSSPLLYFNNYNNDIQQQLSSSSCLTTSTSSSSSAFLPLDFLPYKPINPVSIGKPVPHQLPISTGDLTSNFTFSPFEPTIPAKCNIDVSSMLLNMSTSLLGDFSKASECTDFGGSEDHCSGFSTTALPHEMQAVRNISNGGHHENDLMIKNQSMMNHVDDHRESTVRSFEFPFSLPMSLAETWKPSSLWDSSSCPSEISTSFSTSKCYT